MVFLKGGLGAGNRAFENGAGHGFNIGAAMLYNIPAPLLKPRRVRAQSSKSQLVRRTLTTQHRGGNGFFVILVPHFNFKFRPRFWTYEYKNRAPFLKPIAYIYIYVDGGGRPQGETSISFPSLIVKIGQEKPPKGWGFSCFQVSASFFCLPSSALVFLLCLFWIAWSLKLSHRMRSLAII